MIQTQISTQLSITRLVEQKLQQIDGQSSGRPLLVELGSAALYNVSGG